MSDHAHASCELGDGTGGHALSRAVIEHDPEGMGRADWVIDMGAGHGAGRVVFEGTPRLLMERQSSLTERDLAIRHA